MKWSQKLTVQDARPWCKEYMVKEIAGAEFTTVHSYWVYCDDVICPDRMSRYIYGSLMKSTSMFLFRQWRHVPSDVTVIFGTKSVRFFGPHTRSIYSVGPPPLSLSPYILYTKDMGWSAHWPQSKYNSQTSFVRARQNSLGRLGRAEKAGTEIHSGLDTGLLKTVLLFLQFICKSKWETGT